MENTTLLPSVGDHVKYRYRNETMIATVKSMHAATFSNPGGVTIVDDIGIGYSFAPLRWMDLVMSGRISVLK